MKDYIEERAVEIACYIIENKGTVRQAAKKFGISKSTVHKDCTERLIQINPTLGLEVRQVLDRNKSERHIRGGIATREKYLLMHKKTSALSILQTGDFLVSKFLILYYKVPEMDVLHEYIPLLLLLF